MGSISALIERSNTAAAAAATTLTLDAGASAVDNAYTNMWLEITGAGNAAAVGQARMVTGYVSATEGCDGRHVDHDAHRDDHVHAAPRPPE